MNYDVTSRFELNLADLTVPLPFANELASKHKMAAIVYYDPAVITPLTQLRYSSNGRYKLIMALDFPHGTRYVMEKFKQLPKDFNILNVDGFDILLSSRTHINSVPNEIEVRNEVQVLRDFIQRYNKQIEVRFTIDALSRPTDLVERALKAFKTFAPTFIRLDHNLLIPGEGRASIETIINKITWIRQYSQAPIKVGTNVNLEMVRGLRGKAERFDVSVQAAQQIIHDLEHPPEVKASAPVAATPAVPAV